MKAPGERKIASFHSSSAAETCVSLNAERLVMFYKSMTIPVLVFLSLCFSAVLSKKKQDAVNYKNDFPSHGDLREYLQPLEQVINYSNKFRDQINLDWHFGLFLASVNLHSIIKNVNLSPELKSYLETLIHTNSESMAYVRNHKLSRFDSNVNSLFKNVTTWSKRLPPLEFTDEPIIRYKDTYPNWSLYYREVNDVQKWTPSIEQSDSCFENLSKNDLASCQVPEECYHMLISGTNFGYALTHRLMFLEVALFGQHCIVFSEDQDEYMKDKFCKTIYNEAEYIADHGFKHADLMLEQMTLCSLNGRADFLRRSWLNHLLRHQTPLGCFGEHPATKAKKKKGGKKKKNKQPTKNDIANETCGRHITALGASTLAAAVRLILEHQ